LLSVVVAALLIAVPACNTNDTAVQPVAPVLEKACLELGDPERTSTIRIITPREDQLLNPGSDLFISWVVEEVGETCGDTYVTVQATYHNSSDPDGASIDSYFFKEMIASPANGGREAYRVPNLAAEIASYDRVTCDLVCFWVTVQDELGPVGEPELVAVGPLTAAPTPHRIPQEWTVP
jgi:hypothetical protein